MLTRRRQSIVVHEDGRILLMENGEIVYELPKGRVFAGSMIAQDGRWSTCISCGTRHAVGLRCARCDKSGRDHRNIAKKEVKGV